MTTVAIVCDECGSQLYVNDNPYSTEPMFCNNVACSKCKGKPLPPEMLPRPARRRTPRTRAFKGISHAR